MKIFEYILDEKNKHKFIIASFILLLIGGFFTFKLFSNVTANAEGLLPPDSKSLQDLEISRERLPSVDSLIIFIHSENKESSERFVDDFVTKLDSAPHPLISRVVYNIKEEIDFFINNSPLYNSLWSLEELRDQLFKTKKDKFVSKWKRRLLKLKENINKESEEQRFRLFRYFKYLPDGNLASINGKTRAILIFHAKPMSDVKNARILDSYIRGVIDELDPESYGGNLEFKFSGLANTLMTEYNALWADLIISISITMGLVVLLLFFFYRTYRIVVPLLYVLLLGISVTFSIAFFAFHQLNANSAFMSSIIIGNAINPGIILCSYFIYSRKEGIPFNEAIIYAIKMSLKPTLIGTVAATIAFGSLILSDSKGFFDFGSIGLWGMAIGWICTFVFLPPMLSSKYFQLKEDFIKEYEIPLIGPWKKASSFIFNKAKSIALVCGILAVISFVVLLVIDYEFLERDTTKMRSRNYSYMNFQSIQEYFTKLHLKKELFPSLLILTNEMQDAKKLQVAIDRDKRLAGIAKKVTTFTIYNVIPKMQADKYKVIGFIKKNARKIPDDMKGVSISARQKRLFYSILDTEIKEPVTIEKLPEHVRQYFTELDGSVGKMIFISVDLSRMERDIYLMIDFIERLNKIARTKVGENAFNLTGIVSISTALAKVMIDDASRCIGFAFGAILLVFLGFYRKIKLFPMMILNFCFAMTLFIIIIPLFGIRINFLNFIAIPMTFGIGVDYSSNIIQNVFKQKDTPLRMKNTLSTAGPFIIVASLTTIIGYTSLVFTKTLALSSFGVLCLVGEIVTLLGALLILPGLFAFFYRD